MRTHNLIALAVVAATCLQAATPVQAIENVRGKEYHLTPKHGPWMVMVTSFRNVRDEDLKKDGLTAEQAAAELVFELREMGIPAYTFSQDAVKGEIDTKNRLGRDDHRIYAAQRDMICVLAGNYPSIEDKVGEKTLKLIKKFRPKFLKDSRNGAVLRTDAAQRGPLIGAFMTINPLVKPEDVAQKTADKEIKYLNDGIFYSLIKNPHKYTVRVASFAGKSATPLGNSAYISSRENDFDKKFRDPSANYGINRAGEDAQWLAAFLRKTKPAGLEEAYVYHDKFESLVTIGGFDSPDDPRIRLIAKHYGVELVPDFRLLGAVLKAGQRPSPEDVEKLPKILKTHTEELLPPGAIKGGDTPPTQIWTFDGEPTVILVPRIK